MRISGKSPKGHPVETPARTLVLLAPYAHERDRIVDVERGLRAQAVSLLCPEPLVVIHRRPRPSDVPEGGYVVVDSLVRLGSTPMDALKWIAAAQERQITIYVETGLKLCPGIVAYDLVRRVLREILGVAPKHRSLKTKESSYLARQRGHHVGRRRLPEETVRAALAELDRHASIRAAAQSLQRQGVKISRSALGRLAQTHRRGGDHG